MAKQTSRQLVLDRRQALSQGGKNASIKGSTPVSYTHLTLPTILLV